MSISKSSVSFGDFLSFLRCEKELSLRELGRLSEIDHAYIHRLETGAKEAPSAEIVSALKKSLRLSENQSVILDVLLISPEPAPAALIEFLLEPSGEEFVSCLQPALSMSFRGTRPETKQGWKQILKILKSVEEQ